VLLDDSAITLCDVPSDAVELFVDVGLLLHPVITSAAASITIMIVVSFFIRRFPS
jgi:hypothetical protein